MRVFSRVLFGFMLMLFTGTFFCPDVSAEKTVFGPEIYSRVAGAPAEISETFSVPEPSGEYQLVVQNGESDWGKISSAIITLNGTQVMGPNSFKKKIGHVSIPVQLYEQNEMNIELRSKPGSSIQVSIIDSNGDPVFTSGTINGIGLRSDGSVASNSEVSVQFPSTGEVFQTTTSDTGIFKIEDLPFAGNFVVQIQGEDGYSGSTNDSLTEAQPEVNVTVVLSLPGSGVVTGKVLHADGNVASNVTVSLDFIETDYTASTITSDDGTFSLTGLPTDGSIVVTAFDATTAEHGSEFSFLTASASQQDLNLTITAPAQVNPMFQNGAFSSGTLDGWETEGEVRIIPKDVAFPEKDDNLMEESGSAFTLSTMAFETEEVASTCETSSYSALVTTAGDTVAVGKISQTFKVNPGQDTLTGRIRFVSDEWPHWYGSQYNDSYIVTLNTPGGTKVLSKGNLNTSTWSTGFAEFNGAVPEVNITADVSDFIGQTVTLSVKVSDVGDKVINSGVVVSDFKIVNNDSRNYHSSGSWNSNTTVTGDFGQVVWMTVKNINILGTTITVSADTGKTYQRILLPQQSATFPFSIFAEEPKAWQFDVSTASDAFLVNYTLESTWVPGMPPNPCP